MGHGVDIWAAIAQILGLLAVALALGAICERLRQSAIVGYLLAGALLGPHAANMVTDEAVVRRASELGVALLLFTIGLEFSLRRLRRHGMVALFSGTAQVLVTWAIAGAVVHVLGLSTAPAIAVGAMVALSSTACVLRILGDRAELDTVHGRSSLGILLLQDVAVVPLVLVVTMLGRGDAGLATVAVGLARAAGWIAALGVGCYVIINYGLPWLLRTAVLRNRELFILLAMVTAVGSAWAAHRMDLSPILGAFVAGILLAESPFAVQIRSDVGPLRTLFLTLFFTSIGMFLDPVWVFTHAAEVVGGVAAIVVGKAVVTSLLLVVVIPTRYAVATGVTLSQVGEFSFVLAEISRPTLIDAWTFNLVVSSTIVTLFLTPFLTAAAGPVGAAAAASLRRTSLPTADPGETREAPAFTDHVIVVGFGPAGQEVAAGLTDRDPPVIVELNPRLASLGRQRGYRVQMGDAGNPAILEHLRVDGARALVVTLPDHRAASRVIHEAKALAPSLKVIARSRYHAFVQDLEAAGALVVADEERLVGRQLRKNVLRAIRTDRAVSSARDEAVLWKSD